MLKLRLFTCKSISLYCTLPPLYYFWWIPFVILFNLLFKRTQTIHVVHMNVPFSLTTAFAHSLKWNCSPSSWDTQPSSWTSVAVWKYSRQDATPAPTHSGISLAISYFIRGYLVCPFFITFSDFRTLKSIVFFIDWRFLMKIFKVVEIDETHRKSWKFKNDS